MLADQLVERRVSLTSWDCQFSDAGSKPSRNALGRKQLRQAGSAAAAADGCDLVISAVTAAQDLDAARSVLRSMKSGAWFLDLNSVAPGTRQSVADVVQNVGGRYVEAAIMSPIRPDGIASPVLIGGPHARKFIPLASRLGFTGMTFCSERIGPASATKMCRSVVVKGMESLLVESLLAARYHGVDEAVLASLDNLLPHEDWPRQARYMMSRTLEHGGRRAEEMREAALTVAEAGIEGRMSEACAHSQAQAAKLVQAVEKQQLPAMLDAMLVILSRTATEPQTG